MKRILLTPILLFAFIVTVNAQMHASVERRDIPWNSPHRLTWNDFMAHPDHSVDADAVTSYSISIHPEFINDQKQLKLVVLNNFNKHESWVKSQKSKTSTLLGHEQGHFDLAEVYVRKLRMELSQIKYSKNSSKEIDKIYNRIFSELDQEQRNYDKDTDFSRNSKIQKVWQQRIEEMLRDYEDFAHPVVIIDVY